MHYALRAITFSKVVAYIMGLLFPILKKACLTFSCYFLLNIYITKKHYIYFSYLPRIYLTSRYQTLDKTDFG